jgi:hypothetical protein
LDDLVAVLERREMLGRGFADLALFLYFFWLIFGVVTSECDISTQYAMYAAISPVMSGVTYGDGSTYQDVENWNDLYGWARSYAGLMVSPLRSDSTPKIVDEITRSPFG